jgi:hypothetical protein
MVSLDAQKVLRLFDRQGIAAVARVKIASALRGEIEGVLGDYLRHLTERELGSMKVLRAIQQS